MHFNLAISIKVSVVCIAVLDFFKKSDIRCYYLLKGLADNLVSKSSHKSFIVSAYRSTVNKLSGNINEKKLSDIYVLFSLTVLLLTTVFWSVLSAKIQNYNADQLSYPLQFLHYSSLQKAVIPSTHSFLVKWPLFVFLAQIGPTLNWLLIATVALCLLTVGGLIYFIYRIEKRPLIFGTLCLALASMLLMIPAQPFPGSLLPVNFAMLTTRNICYLILILGIYLALRYKRILSWKFFWAVLLTSLVFASDKLFLTMGVGGAVLAFIFFLAFKMRAQAGQALRWLTVSVAGAILAEVMLFIIKVFGIASLSDIFKGSPYAFIHSFHSLLKGLCYTVLDFAQNFGANPSTNNTVPSQVVSQMHKGLFSPGGVTYIINFLLFLAALYAAGWLIFVTIKSGRGEKTETSVAASTTILLMATTVVSVVLFIFTNHDYSLDSRYLTVGMFALLAALALYTRNKTFTPRYLILAGLVISCGIILGSFQTLATYRNEAVALAPLRRQALRAANTLDQSRAPILIGNYWSTIPVRYFNSKLNVIALYSCTDAVDFGVPASQLNLYKNSFVYLLDHNQCNLSTPLSQFGRPARIVLISGTPEHPIEQLLFYPHGITAGRGSPPSIQ
jgi:hypothetical protein